MKDLIIMTTKVGIVGATWAFSPIFAIPVALGLAYLSEV